MPHSGASPFVPSNGPRLRDYLSYREFLNDYCRHRRALKATWSIGTWARKLGLSDISSITKILTGSRKPGARMTERLLAYFAFDAADAAYFRELIGLEKIANHPRLTLALMERMGVQPSEVDAVILDPHSFALTRWYAIAIREMFKLRDFKPDPEWIAESFEFDVSADEVTEALELLVEIGLVRRAPTGQLEFVGEEFKTPSDVPSEAIRQYHSDVLDCAKQALHQFGVEEREFCSTTLTIDESCMPQAKAKIRAFKDEFVRLFERNAGEATYHVQIQFFPMARPRKETV